MAAPFHPPTIAPTPAPAAAPPPAPMAVRFPGVAQAARPARAIKMRDFRMTYVSLSLPPIGLDGRLSPAFKPRGCPEEFRQGGRHVGESTTCAAPRSQSCKTPVAQALALLVTGETPLMHRGLANLAGSAA